jgi:DNA mismatch repair protein MutS2
MTSGRDVIPIDVRIGAGQRGIVISGPNTGGKTVALKTLGLLSLMAQAGMMIPVLAGSKATVFRSVFADIGDEQSIESNLSSFSGHIANLSEIIRLLDEPALLILDEPGAGTDPAEGSALAIGLMNHLGTRRCMLAIATHSTAVKLHAYSQSGFEAAAVDFDAEHLTPLYRLKPHTIGQSYGLAVARRLGLPEEIIRAAEESMGAGSIELSDALRRLDAERAKLNSQAEKFREREISLAAAERDARESAEKARERADADRKRLRAEVAELIEELRRDGAALMDELKSRAKSRTDLKGFVTTATAKLEKLAPRADSDVPSDAPLKVGDSVEIGDIRGELVVLEAGRAIISRGGLRIEVAPERLRRSAAGTEARFTGARPAAVTYNVERGERGELNVIGMRTTDALRKLEEFLDTAFLTNRAEVRIVHGIGSGALRKAIAEYLGTSPYCASFRAAEPHHGGAGATIVQMNL